VDKLVDEKIAAFVKVVDANPQSKGQVTTCRMLTA
jgi:hypothetical protein